MKTVPLRLLPIIGALVIAGAAHAQYPARPLRIFIPIPPGGGPDVVARIVAERLSPLLGQPIIAETRAGSGGNIATETVSRSAPDGYTMLMAFDAMIVVNPHMYAKMPVDPMKDLVPVSSIAVAHTLFLVANPAFPAKNFQEFIELAKKTNPPLAYASGGNGSQHQLAMELLKMRAGIDLLHVPYKGGAPAATAVIAGEVPVMFAGSLNATQIKAGKLRLLAASGSRSPLFPDAPAIGEIFPGYHVSTWMGFFGPVGMPDAALSRLRADIARVLVLPDTKERLNASSSLDPYVSTPDEFAAVIRADYEKYGKIVRQIGLKAE
jgi:tripartite-type tricarboxylate transporter receptor subunit TctC